ncbi:MAG TPA: DUF4412 domain-containing protein [Bryobacteraceae bacterium]|nr:DUF4412 domain-containing protein [Bryobacteraceae bacterium]
MKTAIVFTVVLVSTAAARADFSYTTARKTTGGAMAGVAGNGLQGSQQFYFKGQKMKVDDGDMAGIIDFDARTVTVINNRQKKVSVQSFDDLAAATKQRDAGVKIDVKESGQKKTVNGYNASELVMTMDVDSPQTRQMGKMQMEMDMWISSDVPGATELRAFCEKNAASFPWAAMAGDSNQGMTAAIADMQRKVARMNGVPVQQIVKIRMAGGPAAPPMPQMSAAQAAQMQDAMAKLKTLQAQGGPAAAGAGSSMMEMTMESTDFSTSSIPDSVFAIPSAYQNLK